VKRNKNNSLLQNYFFIYIRAKRIRKKTVVLTSPHPTLPIRGGLKSD